MINENRPITILGAGSIGIAFALVFSRATFKVHVFDPDVAMRENAIKQLTSRLSDLALFGLVNESPEEIIARISFFDEQSIAVESAQLVIECAPEKVDVKREIFAHLIDQTPGDCVLASASSALPVSHFTEGLPGNERCLIAHPGNPPYLIPVIEIVPAPYTAPKVIQMALSLFRKVQMNPVLVHKEIEGFIFNRLQGAVLREAYNLVNDGIASVEDIDTVMKDGVGLRWSIIGPFETADLNTRGGILSHAEKMGAAYFRMSGSTDGDVNWSPELVSKVNNARRQLLPLERWEQRVAWRDRQLMALTSFRKNKKFPD